jgi:hypothetical protein
VAVVAVAVAPELKLVVMVAVAVALDMTDMVAIPAEPEFLGKEIPAAMCCSIIMAQEVVEQVEQAQILLTVVRVDD